jgi:hypothetical protein
MDAYMIEANEKFFDHLILVLREGGVWGWPAAGYIFTKRGEKLTAELDGLQEVEKIVSKKYFEKNFGIKK